MLPSLDLKNLAYVLIGLLDAVKVANPLIFYAIQGILWVLFFALQLGYIPLPSELRDSLMVVIGLMISSVAPRTTFLKRKLTGARERFLEHREKRKEEQR